MQSYRGNFWYSVCSRSFAPRADRLIVAYEDTPETRLAVEQIINGTLIPCVNCRYRLNKYKLTIRIQIKKGRSW